jgi:hypothetical protein
MAYQATTGLGTPCKVLVTNLNNSTPHSYNLTMSVSGSNGFPSTFQLDPLIVDVQNNILSQGTTFTLSSVTTSSPGTFTLTAAAPGPNNTTVYTGTITGSQAGQTFAIAGFVNAGNNGTFQCISSTSTTLTMANVNGVAETHAGTATDLDSTAIYTGTIPTGGSNALAGYTFTIAGFTNPLNNGTFVCVSSSTTTLILENAYAAGISQAATATQQELNPLVYVVQPAKTYTTGTYGKLPQGATSAIASVTQGGALTALAEGGTVVEINYPTFNNTVGVYESGSSFLDGTYLNKIYAEVNLTVVA